ncbi:MAG: hypothetical protein IPF80_07290, partial [Thermomonas sp.]|nr:hypothetical protein [Thermomonas sp.]
MYQFNEQFTKSTAQFADVAANVNRLALENVRTRSGLQLAAIEENATAAFAFIGELTNVRRFRRPEGRAAEGAQIARTRHRARPRHRARKCSPTPS